MCAVVMLASATAILGGTTHRPDWRAPLERAGIRFIAARELRGMMLRGDRLVLVDARDDVHYRRGRIPGAISVPAPDVSLDRVDIRRPKWLQHSERLPSDRDTTLVFYCGGPN
jgi:rhodanese-related sulfurtransferase